MRLQGNLQVPGYARAAREERTKRARGLNDAANARFVVHQLWM